MNTAQVNGNGNGIGIGNGNGIPNGGNGHTGQHGLKILIIGAGIGVSPAISTQLPRSRNNKHQGLNRSHCTQTARPRGSCKSEHLPTGLQVCSTQRQVFEQSQFGNEVGAAIHLAPNSNGILRRLGIYAEEFGANPMRIVSGNRIGWFQLDADRCDRLLNTHQRV